MGIRRRTARTTERYILGEDYSKVVNKAKLKYRSNKKFYIYKVDKFSKWWTADSVIDNYEIEHENWTFDTESKKWINNSN